MRCTDRRSGQACLVTAFSFYCRLVSTLWSKPVQLSACGIALLALVACGGTSGPSSSAPPPASSLALSAAAADRSLAVTALRAPPALRRQLEAQRTGAAAAVQPVLAQNRRAGQKALIDDLVALIGPPPDATVQADEIAYLRTLKTARTTEGTAAADDLDMHGLTDVWDTFAASSPEPTKLHDQLTQLQDVLDRATSRAKKAYRRPGPRVVAPDLAPGKANPSKVSYPSSHSAYAYAQAALLASADPSRSITYYDAASTVAFSRLYVAGHYPSDIVAGARLGFLLEALVTQRGK